MATIKSFTSLEQSKKLAKILPIESADMCYVIDYAESNKYGTDHFNLEIDTYGLKVITRDNIPCWSLASLLGVIKKYGLVDLRFLYSTFDNKGTHLTNVWNLIFEDIDNESLDIYADKPVDACVELILKLHELNLL